MPDPSNAAPTRRQLLRTVLLGLAGLLPARPPAKDASGLCRGDVAVSAATALLFPRQAPLVPVGDLRDARAVWAGIPSRPDPGVLVFLHGFDNYVTVDSAGRSRVPDWAAADPAARAGVTAKPAAPLVYGLDRLTARAAGNRPLLLVPEDGTLATGAFWSRVPAGQYTDPARLGQLVSDCLAHLACLPRPDGRPYLGSDFDLSRVKRLYLCGHSGAGLALQEAAGADLLRPDGGLPCDLWLFDCTYWSQVAGFVQFCARWHAAGRLAGGAAHAARFVCLYRAGTPTEPVADALRAELARVLGVPAASLVRDHTPDNFAAEIRPALRSSAVLFLRTYLPHDDIPTVFIPALLQTAKV